MAPQSFTIFPELPAELRLKIWQLALPGPRILSVRYKPIYAMNHGRMQPQGIQWKTSDPVPSILHVCHEAREVALKKYKHRQSFSSQGQQAQNYVDFDLDTLYFGGSGTDLSSIDTILATAGDSPGNYMLDMFIAADYGAGDVNRIKRMIVDIDEERYGRRHFIWEEILHFTKLEDLRLLSWDVDADIDATLYNEHNETLTDVARQHPDWKPPRTKVICVHSKLS